MISYRKLAMRVLGHSPVSAAKTARRRSTAKRAAALALTAALVVGMTLPAFAQDWFIENGDIEISAGESGNKVVQNGEEKAANDTDTVIKSNYPSTASSNSVTIEAGAGKTVNVTLDNVNIDTSGTWKAAVSVIGSGDTNIELNGNNTLTSGDGHAGLEHNKKTDSEGKETSGTLTIQDEKNDDGSAKGSASDTTGSLTANGGFKGAGIGGSNEKDGQVTITGGEITANGGYKGAGIGGGYSSNGTVTITDGDINANGGYKGAGIGGGDKGNGTVEITGGDITANGGDSGAGIGGGNKKDGQVTITGGEITATGGLWGTGIGGGVRRLGNVSIEGNVTIKNAQGGAGAAGIGGGARAEPDTEDTRNKISIKSTEAGSPTITATGGGAYKDDYVSLPVGAAAIGSGSVYETIGEVNAKSDIIIEGKVTINATGGGNVAIGDNDGEKVFNGLAGGTNIKRTDSNGKDVTQDGDVVAEPEPEPRPEPEEPEKPAQPTVTPTGAEMAEAPSTGSVEVEHPVTVEGLYVTNVLGKQITHTCTQNGTTLTIRVNGIATSAHLTLGMVRTLKAQGVETLVLTTLLSRSTTVSVDALLAADPDAPDETPVVWTHTGVRTALTIGGADHSALLK